MGGVISISIKEKQHRLPRECYQGQIRVAFTLCIRDGKPCFVNNTIVSACTLVAQSILERKGVKAIVYCFMPDHLHLILQGGRENSNLGETIIDLKQHTGFWFRRNLPQIRWQKDFYDHIIRQNEDLKAKVEYILNNPVRKGIVQDWAQYPYKGAIGYNLEEVVAPFMGAKFRRLIIA
jgi:putative transposase